MRPIETKLMEVAAFVRSKHRAEHRDDAGQDAYLAARETWDRYGHKVRRGQEFTYLCGPAFMKTTLELRLRAAVCSISTHVAGGRVKANTDGCFGRVSLFTRNRGTSSSKEERFKAQESTLPGLRGELDRLAKVVELFRALGKNEKRLIMLAVVDARDAKLQTLAIRSRLSRDRAAEVLRAFVDVVGPDPSVSHLARVISRA